MKKLAKWERKFEAKANANNIETDSESESLETKMRI